MVLYSKACRKCDPAYRRGEEAEDQECPKNFEGSSKSMEASAILKMVEDALYYRFLSLMSLLVTMIAQCELCSIINPNVPEVKL